MDERVVNPNGTVWRWNDRRRKRARLPKKIVNSWLETGMRLV